MFCPECGTLAFPDPSGAIRCTNYTCGYSGDASNLQTMEDGSVIDLSKAASSSDAKSLKHLTEVVDEKDMHRGAKTSGAHICPKCDCVEVYVELHQTRSSDEPETRFLTCDECGHGWREY